MNPSTDETADTQTLRQSRELDADLKPKASQTSQWGPPESVAKLSQEERLAAERRLKRKIDFRLLPALVIMYILSNPLLWSVCNASDYLDRNAIASTRLAGITTDLNLVGNEFQTAVSILFVGYYVS